MESKQLTERLLNQETIHFTNGENVAMVYWSYVRKSVRIMVDNNLIEHDRTLENLSVWLRIRKYKETDLAK